MNIASLGEGDLSRTVMDRDVALDVVHRAIERYIAERRAKIPEFIDRNFSLSGALRLHRKAAGWDFVVAPVNVALAVPHVCVRLMAAASRSLGWARASEWLDRRRLFFTSAVARELEWRLFSELLELPYARGDRHFNRDALAEEILRDPRVERAVGDPLQSVGRRLDDPEFRGWLLHALRTYTGSRVAAGDLTTALLSAGAGAVAFSQLTPSMLTLGPALAYSVAQQVAIATFPLGAGVGGLWYAAFPASASAGLVVGMTGGAMAVGAMFVAFSGVITDPIQRRLGLHRRRLQRLVDCLERELQGAGKSRFAVCDHYVARIIDVCDFLRAAYRLAT